jgi:hypothetical protein
MWQVEAVTRNRRSLMGYSHSKSSEAQYVDTKFIREHLMVSRTKSFEIAKEIENADAPGAVIRFGRCLRVRKDAFIRWVDVHGAGSDEASSAP